MPEITSNIYGEPGYFDDDYRWHRLPNPPSDARNGPVGNPPATQAIPLPVPLDIDLTTSSPWVIGPCIKPADCCYFVGRPGHGKTNLVADILVSAVVPMTSALGGAWKINRDILPAECKVAIINAETNGPEAWARMIMGALSTRDIHPMSTQDILWRRHFDYYEATELPLSQGRRDVEAIAEAFIARDYKIVVLDPVFNAFSPPDNGDSKWVIDGLSPFVRALRSAGIHVFCIAHPSSASLHYRSGEGVKISVERAFMPFGTIQQYGVIDCLFGVYRPKGKPAIELIKIKDRRASWIPSFEARINLAFGHGGGYSAHTLKECWDYENPEPPPMSPRALRNLSKLPDSTPFTRDDITFREKDFREDLELYYGPLGLITVEQLAKPGAPKLFHWTEVGLRYRTITKR